MKIRFQLALILLLFFSSTGYSADYFWIGGSGDWSNISHWATASGGSITHAQVPTSDDNVYFDENSFTGPNDVVSISGNLAFSRDISFTSIDRPFTFNVANTGTLNVFGSFLSSDLAVLNIEGNLTFSGSDEHSIDMLGATIGQDLTISGSGSWTMMSNISVTDQFLFDEGALYLGTSEVSCAFFHSRSNANRTLFWENGVLEVSGDSFDPFFLGASDQFYSLEIHSENWNSVSENGLLSLTSPFAKILVQSREIFPSDPGGNVAFDAIEVTADNGLFEIINWFDMSTLSIQELTIAHNTNLHTAAEIGNLNLTSGFRYSFQSNSDFQIGNIVASGSCESSIVMNATMVGQAANFSILDPANLEYIEIGDINLVQGIGNINNGINLGNTDGWNISERASSTYYWIGNNGNWSDGNNWSLSSGGPAINCIPSTADNVVFDDLSFSAPDQFVTVDIPNAFCRTMSWTNISDGSGIIGTQTATLSIFGSLYFTDNMNNGFEGEIRFVGQGDFEVVSAGNAFDNDVIFENANGNWVILDDITVSPSLRILTGHVQFNDVVITTYLFDTKYMTPREIDFGNSTLVIDNFDTNGPRADINMANLELNSDSLTVILESNSAEFRVYGQESLTIHRLISNAANGSLQNRLFGGDMSLIIKDAYFRHRGQFLGQIEIENLILTGGNEYILDDFRSHLFLSNVEVEHPCYGLVSIFTQQKDNPEQVGNITFEEQITLEGFRIRNINAISNFGPIDVNRGLDAGRNTGFNFIDFTSRDLFWIGGEGQWHETSNWSLTSGGTGGECPPTHLDNVFFDENSFQSDGQRVFSDSLLKFSCKDFSFTAEQNDILFDGHRIDVSGDLLLENFVDWQILNLLFTGEEEDALQSLMTSETRFHNIIFYGNSDVELLDDLTVFEQNREITFTTSAEFYGNGFDINTPALRILHFEGAPIFHLSGTTINISNNANSFYEPLQITSNISVDFDEAQIVFTGENGGLSNFGQLQIRHLIFLNPNGLLIVNNKRNMNVGRMDVFGNGEFNADSNNGFTADSLFFYPGSTYTFEAQESFSINSLFHALGNNCAPISISSNTIGTRANINMPSSSTINMDFVEMRDLNAVGGQEFNAGSHSTDIATSNQGWLFPEIEDANQENGLLGPDVVLCGDQSIVLRASSNTANETYLWNNGVTSSNIEVTQSDTYSVLITFLSGCEIRDTIEIIAADEIPIDLPNDTVICSDINLFFDANIDIESAKYEWNTGLQESGISINTPGQYTLEVSVGECSVIDSFLVEQVTLDNFKLGNDTTLCNGDFVTIGFESSESVMYNWNTGENTSEIDVNTEGVYRISIATDMCNVEDSILVSIQELPVFSFPADTSICSGEEFTLSSPIDGASYSWSQGSNNPEIIISEPDNYKLTVTDETGCSYSDSLEVFTTPSPVIFTRLNDTVLCEGDVLKIELEGMADALSWENSGTSTLSTQEAGIFFAVAMNGECFVRDSILLTLTEAPFVNLGNDTTICSGDSFELIATHDTGFSVEWQDGSSDPSYSVLSSGNYWATVSAGSCSSIDSLNIEVVNSPMVNIMGITEACEGEMIELVAVGDLTNLTWNTGESNPSILVSQSGIYNVEVINTSSCSDTESIEVFIAPRPTVVPPNDTIICEDEILNINFEDSSLEYDWLDGFVGNTRSINEEGEYEVNVVNEWNCDTDFSFNVMTRECTEFMIYVPNAFAPSSNNNSSFAIAVPSNIVITTWNLNIFDRWGNKVFHSADPNQRWDGRSKNQNITSGVYIYSLETNYIDDLGSGSHKLQGSVTLIK